MLWIINILCIILLIVLGIPGIIWWKKDGYEIIKNKKLMKEINKDPFDISDDELLK